MENDSKRKKDLIDYDKTHLNFLFDQFFSLAFFDARARDSIIVVLYKLKFNRKFLFPVGFVARFFSLNIVSFALKHEERGLFEPGNVNNHPHTKCYCIFVY